MLELADVTVRGILRLCRRAFRLGGKRQDRARTCDLFANGRGVAGSRSAMGADSPPSATMTVRRVDGERGSISA